jgi:predicted nucleotidyltransferase component of viral defense system
MFTLPNQSYAIHKAWLYRLLINIADNQFLNENFVFKGGTCAAMRGFLNRFSVDLDFELCKGRKNIKKIKNELEIIFQILNLQTCPRQRSGIKDKSSIMPQYFLKYNSQDNQRNTIKIDVTTKTAKSNEYELIRFTEIDRILNCYTVETLFANKLVALLDRYKKHKSIAGRDLYDIHSFFIKGFRFNEKIIYERTKLKKRNIFKKINHIY